MKKTQSYDEFVDKFKPPTPSPPRLAVVRLLSSPPNRSEIVKGLGK